MSILDKSYTAVRFDGTYFEVPDVCDLINDWGIGYEYSRIGFLGHVGVSHGVCGYGQAMNHWERLASTPEYRYKDCIYRSFGNSLAYRYMYVLVDGSGRVVCPNELILAYLNRYPRALRRKERSYKRSKSISSIRNGGWTGIRVRRVYAGVQVEEGEPPMNKSEFRNFFWDSEAYRINERNWKSQRKTQWKDV